MLISRNLHTISREVSIKTKSPPASFSFKGQATKHTTVKWSIFVFNNFPQGHEDLVEKGNYLNQPKPIDPWKLQPLRDGSYNKMLYIRYL